MAVKRGKIRGCIDLIYEKTELIGGDLARSATHLRLPPWKTIAGES